MVSGVEIVREGYFGTQYNAHYALTYMALFCVGLTILALGSERIISRQVIPE
jgi:hypothetical protein